MPCNCVSITPKDIKISPLSLQSSLSPLLSVRSSGLEPTNMFSAISFIFSSISHNQPIHILLNLTYFTYNNIFEMCMMSNVLPFLLSCYHYIYEPKMDPKFFGP